MGPDVQLVSVMKANSETGVLSPVPRSPSGARQRESEPNLHDGVRGDGAPIILDESHAPSAVARVAVAHRTPSRQIVYLNLHPSASEDGLRHPIPPESPRSARHVVRFDNHSVERQR